MKEIYAPKVIAQITDESGNIIFETPPCDSPQEALDLVPPLPLKK